MGLEQQNLKIREVTMQNTAQEPEYQEELSPRLKNMSRIRESLKDFSLISQNKAMVTRKLSMHSISETDSPDGLSLDVEDTTLRTNADHAELFAEKYDLLKKVGEGSNGVVHRCLKKKSGTEYAAKAFTFQDEHLPQLRENFLLIKHLSHLCVIKYEALYLDLKKHLCWLVMQFFEGGSLARTAIAGEDELREIARQLLQTLCYLHQRSVTHRDIKPENILYDPQLKKVKMIDFGICGRHRRRGIRSDMLTITGTLFYRAPEMFMGGGYNEKVDVWSTGVLIYKLVSGKTPFESIYHSQTINNIQNREVEFPPCFDQYSPALKGLVAKMLKKNPKERLSALDCLRDAWFIAANPNPNSTVSISQHHKSNYSLESGSDSEEDRELDEGGKSPIGDMLEQLTFVRKINGDEYHCFDSDDDEEVHRLGLKRTARSMTSDLTSLKS